MNSLKRIRDRIDAGDLKILALLNARARLVIQVGKLKHREKKAGHPAETAFVPHRERQIFDRLRRHNTGPFSNEGLTAVFREIMSVSLALEGKPRIACAGSESTSSQRAARLKFGSQCEYLAASGVAGVFSDVEKGRADLGVVPLEHAGKGLVRQSLGLFAKSALNICGEISLGSGRFVVVGRTLAEPTGKDKTSILVHARSKPALLKLFKTAGVRVSALGTAGASTYFVDFLGHQRERRAAGLLETLAKDDAALKVLGSYPLA